VILASGGISLTRIKQIHWKVREPTPGTESKSSATEDAVAREWDQLVLDTLHPFELILGLILDPLYTAQRSNQA
jgi:hypothetical protein